MMAILRICFLGQSKKIWWVWQFQDCRHGLSTPLRSGFRRRPQSFTWTVLLIGLMTILLHMPNVQATEHCDIILFDSDSTNTFPEVEEDGVTIIGHLPNLNYVVVVPGQRESLLIDIRRYVPDAFMTTSRLGDYVHAGAFDTRRDAEVLSRKLRACKIRSRVVYFRSGAPI